MLFKKVGADLKNGVRTKWGRGGEGFQNLSFCFEL